MENCPILCLSGCLTIPGVNDAAEFAHLMKAMDCIGITSAERNDLFRLLSALLHMSKIEFESGNTDKIATRLRVGSVAHKAVADLLGLDLNVLSNAMINRTMRVRKAETITITLNVQDATYARDAFAKYIYGQVFLWIVSRVNASVPTPPKDANPFTAKVPLPVRTALYSHSSLFISQRSSVLCVHHLFTIFKATSFIGILDISGFEIFEINSFEQLCINHANEKIQQYFNKQILQQEQEIYKIEGLKFKEVAYMDNQDIIDLIEEKAGPHSQPGILALLNDECITKSGSDKVVINQSHLSSFNSNPCRPSP